jgi:hypothetical protein
MNIDNLISSFDFEKFKKDCILHSMLRLYIDKKSELSPCDHSKTNILIKQLEKYSDVLKRLLSHAKCFPDSCDNCEGLTKCIDCITKDNCVDAQLMFHKLMQQNVTT